MYYTPGNRYEILKNHRSVSSLYRNHGLEINKQTNRSHLPDYTLLLYKLHNNCVVCTIIIYVAPNKQALFA